MPIFEYQCKKCHHHFEYLVRNAKKPACPSCGNQKLEKLFSAFSRTTKGQRFSPSDFASQEGCGSCGDPRGPGACRSES